MFLRNQLQGHEADSFHHYEWNVQRYRAMPQSTTQVHSRGNRRKEPTRLAKQNFGNFRRDSGNGNCDIPVQTNGV